MTQSIAAAANLGPSNTGLTIGITVLNLNRTSYAAFSTTSVSESSDVPGLYYKSGALLVPDTGCFIQWGTAGTVYAEATVMPAVDTSTLATAAALATVDGIVDSILTDTDVTIPGLIAALNDVSAADVNAQVDIALADYDAPTKAELDAGLAALNDPTAAAIADAVWDEATAGHVTAGTYGVALTDVLADTGTDIPSTLSTLATQAQVNGLNDPTAAAIADAVWDEAKAGHTTSSTFGKILQDLETTLGTVASNVAAVLTDTDTTIPALIAGLNDPAAAAIADAVWDELLSGHVIAGSAGAKLSAAEADTDAIKLTVDANLDAAVSTRSTFNHNTDSVTVGANGDKTGYSLATNQSSVTIGTVTTVTNPVTAGTVSDKTGYSISGSKTTLDALNDISAADVNAQLVDVLFTDTMAELASAPAATVSLATKITWLYQLARNRMDQSGSQQTTYADDAATSVATAAVSDSGTVFTRAEWA